MKLGGRASKLVGRRFGKLTVIKPTNKRIQKQIVWCCQCDCGKIKYSTTSTLVKNQVKSCKSHQCRPDFDDITGKKFSRLTVIKYEKSVKGQLFWQCLCDCGNTTVVMASPLRNLKTKSCGCKRRDHELETLKSRCYRVHVEGSVKRDISPYLSKEEYLDIAKNPCHYCGKIDVKYNQKRTVSLNMNGIDRKNNEKFYNKENSLPCCKRHNTAKTNLSYDEYILDIEAQYFYLKGVTK